MSLSLGSELPKPIQLSVSSSKLSRTQCHHLTQKLTRQFLVGGDEAQPDLLGLVEEARLLSSAMEEEEFGAVKPDPDTLPKLELLTVKLDHMRNVSGYMKTLERR